MAFPRLLLPTLLLLFTTPTALGEKKCYFPDGNEAQDPQNVDHYTPCKPDGDEHSQCCIDNQRCLTNGLCIANHQWNWVWREACTDPTWQDPACSARCFGNNGENSTVRLAFSCDDFTGDNYCCGTGPVASYARDYNTTCCNDTDLTFEAAPFSAYTMITPASTSIASASATTGATVTGSVISSSVGPSSTDTAVSTSPTASPSPHSNTVAIALGVCVPVAVLSLAAFAFLFWKSRRQKRRFRAAEQFSQHASYTTDSKWPVAQNAHGQSQTPRELLAEADAQELYGSEAFAAHPLMEEHATGEPTTADIPQTKAISEVSEAPCEAGGSPKPT